PPVLWIDCETYAPDGVHVEDRGPNEDWLTAAVDECRQLNVRPGIYTGSGRGTAATYLNNSTTLTDLPFWTCQPAQVAHRSNAKAYSGWKLAMGKQWNTTRLDRDVFDVECTRTGGAVVEPRTFEDVEAENPNIREQLRRKQNLQVLDGLDPFDYAAFRQFLS